MKSRFERLLSLVFIAFTSYFVLNTLIVFPKLPNHRRPAPACDSGFYAGERELDMTDYGFGQWADRVRFAPRALGMARAACASDPALDIVSVRIKCPRGQGLVREFAREVKCP